MAYISFQPSDFFSSKIYVGTGSTATVTGVGFQPDIAWIKIIESAYNATMWDSVRGANNRLFTPTNAANVVDEPDGYVSAFTADGYTVTAGSSSDDYVNNTSDDYVTWNWKAGTTSGLTGGTITPTAYSISTTALQSIITYTGNGTAGATIPHGLGVAPNMIIIKKLSTTGDWWVYNSGMDGSAPEDYHLVLNSTAARVNNNSEWYDTAPTSTLVTLGSGTAADTVTYVAYCFANKKGYSQFGNYFGNGNAEGPFVYTGFRPGFILIKNTATTNGWNLYDSARSTSNVNNQLLPPQTSAAQSTSANWSLDMLSNGFKIRDNNNELNDNAARMLYAAFSEFPIVSSNNVPVLAK